MFCAPPSFAMVALLDEFSWERAHSAEADCSLVSGLASRTRLHSGAIAPVRAIAAWLSTLSRESEESAAAALVQTSDCGDPSKPTSGGMAPVSAIVTLLSMWSSDILHMASAASAHCVTASVSLEALAPIKASTSRGIPPAVAIASWLVRDLHASCMTAAMVFSFALFDEELNSVPSEKVLTLLEESISLSNGSMPPASTMLSLKHNMRRVRKGGEA